MLGEVDRRAEVRRPMQAVDEPVDDRAREQLEVLDARQDLGVDEPCAGNDVGFHDVQAKGRGRRPEALGPDPASALPVPLAQPRPRAFAMAYMPDFGSGTVFSNSSISASRRDAFGLGAEVREHAVAKDRMRQRT